MGYVASRRAGFLALFALVFQNTSLAIVLKLTFRKGAEPYSPSSVVLVTELLKLALCTTITAYHSKRGLLRVFSNRKGQLLLVVPSCLYVIQNNLLFVGAKMLPTVVYIVCTQTKILTTALMSRLILGTRLDAVQYMSLFFLTIGICFVQQHEEGDDSAKASKGNLASGTLGVIAVLLASLTSGTAGILLEKVYKGLRQHNSNSILEDAAMEHTIWTRNVQLSLISLPFALLGALLQSDDSTVTYNLTRGFDACVWSVVVLQAAGGVIISFVMMFANNIIKCFAVAVSICCCAVYSVAVGDLDMSASLVFGICLVIGSAYSFSRATIKTVEENHVAKFVK